MWIISQWDSALLPIGFPRVYWVSGGILETVQMKGILDKDEVTGSTPVSPTEVRAMNFIRRVFMVLGIAGIAAAILRVKGKSEISTRRGGWRQVNPPISE